MQFSKYAFKNHLSVDTCFTSHKVKNVISSLFTSSEEYKTYYIMNVMFWFPFRMFEVTTKSTCTTQMNPSQSLICMCI